MKDTKYRKHFENLLDEVNNKGFKLSKDSETDGDRIVVFEKYQVIISLIQTSNGIDFDIYANLKGGIYELGDLHLITRKMFDLKKLCMKFNCREMNTTERLYPSDRQGLETKTSGL